jgi:hypothetical protein
MPRVQRKPAANSTAGLRRNRRRPGVIVDEQEMPPTEAEL